MLCCNPTASFARLDSLQKPDRCALGTGDHV